MSLNGFDSRLITSLDGRRQLRAFDRRPPDPNKPGDGGFGDPVTPKPEPTPPPPPPSK